MERRECIAREFDAMFGSEKARAAIACIEVVAVQWSAGQQNDHLLALDLKRGTPLLSLVQRLPNLLERRAGRWMTTPFGSCNTAVTAAT